MSAEISALILAAGKGVRMKSDLPKVLHPILGRPMVQYVIEAARVIKAEPVSVVVGYGRERLEQALKHLGVAFITQAEQLGTGHAVRCYSESRAKPPEHLLVVCGDTPLLSHDSLRAMTELHLKEQPALTMLTLDMAEPGNYGRIIRDQSGAVKAIREAKDCTPEQKMIGEVNLAVYLFKGKHLFEMLPALKNENNQKEYYLTDIVEMTTSDGLKVLTVKEKDETSTLGINSRSDMAKVTRILKDKIIEKHMANGVTIIDPAQTLIEPDVQIGSDTTIWPGTTITGNTKIGKRCVLGPLIHISDSAVGDDQTIKHCVLKDQEIPNRK